MIVGASRTPSRDRRRQSSDAGEPRRIRIVVTPLASQSMKSDVSRVWTCISARPGRRYLPVPSMTRQHTCAGRAPARATCTIRPPCTRTVWGGRTRAESIGTTDTFQMARTESQGCCTARPRTAIGPYAGFLCGALLWLGITLAMGAVATVFADAALGLLPGLGGPLPRAVLLIAVIAGLAVVNIRGAALGSRVSGIATVAKIVPLIAFVALGLPHVRAENLAPGSFPSLSRLGESGLLLMFAFFGMESALQVSGEVRDGARAVPRAIALAVTGVGGLYIAIQLVAQGILGSALAAPETAKAPLAAAAAQIPGRAGSTLILIAMIVSTFGFMTATMLSTPRTLFALAVDGYLPRPLAAVHRAHHTPHVAIAIQGVIVCAIATTGTYVKLAIMANVAILLVYLACCLGVWRLRRLGAGAADKPFVMPAGPGGARGGGGLVRGVTGAGPAAAAGVPRRGH